MKKYFYLILFFSSFMVASSQPSLFKYNQSTFQAFYFFKNVMIDSNLVEADDWVGTFNCIEWNADSLSCKKIGSCVGARRWDTTKCGSGICDLPAMGHADDATDKTKGYLQDGQYPVFLIYDQSLGVYYKTDALGDVTIQKDLCRNGYPFCYEWENFSFYFIEKLKGTEIFIDCSGKIGGNSVIDDCGICGGNGPKYFCKGNNHSYCTEFEFEQECLK